jgi:hypothetical protein
VNLGKVIVRLLGKPAFGAASENLSKRTKAFRPLSPEGATRDLASIAPISFVVPKHLCSNGRAPSGLEPVSVA